MKRSLLSFTFLLLSTSLFAAPFQDAENKIQAIESYKNVLVESKKHRLLTLEETSTLNSMYRDLEETEYTVSTKDGTLSLTIGDYDFENTMWPVNVYGSFLDNDIILNRDIRLFYSTLMERQHVAEKDMADYQRRDYEFYVTEYENKIRSGEEIIYAEMHIKVQRWIKASQYRFRPTELLIYKKAKEDRIILTVKDIEPSLWIHEPAVESRSKNEIRSDQKRTKEILYAESREVDEAEEPEQTEEEHRKGRRAIYFSLETFRKEKNENAPQISSMDLNYFDASLTFGIGNYVFAGLEMCFDLSTRDKNSVYSFGVLAGGNIQVTNYFRPFIITGAAVRTDDRAVFKCGAGLDVTLGHLLLTGSYNYNWNNSFSSEGKTHEDDRENKRFHSVSAGIGFTW